MIEVEIDSIRVSLISQHRIVMLRELGGQRQLPIWIGPCEAEAITIELQDTEISRPLTHDLLKNTIEQLNAKISHIVVSELRNQVFYANLVLDVRGKQLEVDCRPSDAIALAVRAKVPIFIAEEIMDEVGVLPEPDVTAKDESGEPEKLDAFMDFVDTLDLDDFDE